MKLSKPLIWILSLGLIFTACKSYKQYGDEVDRPFTGNKYESNSRYLRSTGKGQSVKSQIAKKKADMDAKSEMASQVNSIMKGITDQYASQSETVDAAEVLEKFQLLSREVVNTEMADLRKIGEKTFFNGEEYTVFVAYEIHKKSMLKFLKKLAEADASIRPDLKRTIEKMIDEELEEIED